MSVEEMISSFDGRYADGEFVNFNDAFRASIIAALRAGQHMRDAIDDWWEAGTSDTRMLYEASQVWDAATREGGEK